MRALYLSSFAILASLTLTACASPQDEPSKPFPNALMTPAPKALPVAKLVTGAGKALPADTLRGHWTWLYFGFTNCPDVCPAALGDLAKAYNAVKNHDRLKVVFVSVDPNRDQDPRLEKFVTYFHPEFVAATGDKSQIDLLTKAIGASYIIDKPTKPGGNYTVSHSNLVFILDPEGRFVACYPPPVEGSKLADDFNQLIAKEAV